MRHSRHEEEWSKEVGRRRRRGRKARERGGENDIEKWETEGCPLTYMLRSGQHISADTAFKGVKQFAQQAMWNLLDAHDIILEHRIEQTHYSNKHCKPGIEYQIDDLIYLSTKNLTLPKHRA